MKSKRWIVAPALAPEDRLRFDAFHPVLAQILYNRGFTDPAMGSAFLAGTAALGDPFKMKGIGQAVARIRHAIRRKEPIIVYGDFDADGVTSTALLVSVLRALDASVQPYIPHRVDEGYGLNDDALIRLAKDGAKLVITVDCGIRSLREVETGIRAGLDMIVTDHHSIGPELPRATAVINPKQEGCKGEPMLAGVGVTFKLATALLKASEAQDRRAMPIQPETLLDLVAIGTVADLVPLDRAENRALVTRGLTQLRHTGRPGLRALMQVAGVAPANLEASSIGFGLGPRINAAGRLESAMIAYELLTAQDDQQALGLAERLQQLNVKRQELTREMQAYARSLAGLERFERGEDVPLIFAADANFQQGIVGLVAGRLAEEFYRPAIVVHHGEHESHGSCRSIEEFNITEALDECADLLIRHGGHAQAAGFAIHNTNLPVFRERMMGIASAALQDKPLQPSLDIDAEVKLGDIAAPLYEALRSLEPCGNSMPAPMLCVRRVRLREGRAVGKDGSHLKLRLEDPADPKVVRDGIGFGLGALAGELPPYVDVAFQIVSNEWNGNTRLEMMVQDIRWTEVGG